MTDIKLNSEGWEAAVDAILKIVPEGYGMTRAEAIEYAEASVTAYLTVTQQSAKADLGEMRTQLHEQFQEILCDCQPEWMLTIKWSEILDTLVEAAFDQYGASAGPASESVGRLVIELQKLEWAKDPDGYGYWCRACGRGKEDHHQPDCTLARALAPFQPKKEQDNG